MEEALSMYLQRFPLTSLSNLSSHFQTNGSLNRRESGLFFFSLSPASARLPKQRFDVCTKHWYKFNGRIFTQRSQGPGSEDKSPRGVQGQPFFSHFRWTSISPHADIPPPHRLPSCKNNSPRKRERALISPSPPHCSRKHCFQRVCSQEKMP